jgi:glucose-1-phosphate cytidylyltransferase
MIEVGDKPILWHIMKGYAYQGFREFVIAVGYKGDVVKRYFLNYQYLQSDLTISLAFPSAPRIHTTGDDWTISIVDTGLETQTGGRLRRVADYLDDDEPFMMTYGDGVANLNLHRLLDYHHSHEGLATVTAVRPPARWGHMEFEGDKIVRFTEKPPSAEGWINGGFFVLDKKVLSYIDGDDTPFEIEPMRKLGQDGKLFAHRHQGFWHSMDTLRDVRALNAMWAEDMAPWKVWQ